MNMKKTIAAVAACAMAVSAMATTVSAVDENATQGSSWNYSLVTRKMAYTADLTFTAKDVAGATTGNYVLDIFGYGLDFTKQTVSVTVADKSTKTSSTFQFKTDNTAADYDGYAKVDTVTLYAVKDDGVTAATKENEIAKYSLKAPTSGTSDLNLKSDNDHIQISIPEKSTIYNAFKATTGTNIDITVKVTAIDNEYKDQGALNVALGTTGKPAKAGLVTMDATQTTVYQTGKSDKFIVKTPFKTTSNTASAGTSEVFARLATPSVRVGGDTNNLTFVYDNAKAVINDMIANYDDVVFTFNTATDNVLTPEYIAANSWIGNGVNYPDSYVANIPGVETWMGVDTYKAFPQHLYNLYGDESTKYTYSETYQFNNLFNAALVANNAYTMNQSTISPFEYNKTSVSFSWNDLTGGASFINRAGTLDTLQLATSSTWYWDSMDVTGYTLAADDASTDAGIEDDGADLDDDAADDADVADDDVADDDVADDDAAADDDVADDDVAADDTAADDTAADSNPATGNAPIALAVIPVALAAAAVVAKKRG